MFAYCKYHKQLFLVKMFEVRAKGERTSSLNLVRFSADCYVDQ